MIVLTHDDIAALEARIAARPCGCYACDDGVQPGHFLCCAPSERMLELERRRVVTRVYDGAWRWTLSGRANEADLLLLLIDDAL